MSEKFDTFLNINGRDFNLEELAKHLGITEIKDIRLCQKVPAGTLVATTEHIDTSRYPGLAVELHLPDDAGTLPILISQTEQPARHEDGDQVRTYLYGRGDSYIGFMNIDTRPDDIELEDPRQPVIVASGDRDATVIVRPENNWVKYDG